MRKIGLLTLCLAAVAWAGSRVKESAGAVPTLATDGVSLLEVEACRPSVRVDGGGTINGGTLVSYYYDSVLGWTRSATRLDCVLEANKLLDGGAPSAQVCPDTEPVARFGRVAFVANNIVGADGGTPNGVGVDGGQNIAPVVRVECFGRALP